MALSSLGACPIYNMETIIPIRPEIAVEITNTIYMGSPLCTLKHYIIIPVHWLFFLLLMPRWYADVVVQMLHCRCSDQNIFQKQHNRILSLINVLGNFHSPAIIKCVLSQGYANYLRGSECPFVRRKYGYTHVCMRTLTHKCIHPFYSLATENYNGRAVLGDQLGLIGNKIFHFPSLKKIFWDPQNNNSGIQDQIVERGLSFLPHNFPIESCPLLTGRKNTWGKQQSGQEVFFCIRGKMELFLNLQSPDLDQGASGKYFKQK